MALSNTATPKYYGRFRDAVLRGEIPAISLRKCRIKVMMLLEIHMIKNS